MSIVKMQVFSAKGIAGSDFSTDVLPVEYHCYGSADFRIPTFQVEYENEHEYEGYKIFKGKKGILGLPATYVEKESEAQTLEIELIDRLTGLKVLLSYTKFENFDAITKSVKIVNGRVQGINIKSALSSTVHLFDKDFDFVHLEGVWARERHIRKSPLLSGIMQIDSKHIA